MLRKIKKYYNHAYKSGLYPSFNELFFSNKKIVAYYGFLGDKNFGDEWVFESAKELFPNQVLLPIHHRMPISALLIVKIFKHKVKGVVIGGGTLMGINFWFKDYFLSFRAKNLPVFVHGTGVHNHQNFNLGWKSILSGNFYGGVRGDSSVENLLKYTGVKAGIIGDASFAMAENNSYERKGNKVLINLGTHLPFEGQEQSRDAVYKFVDYLIRENYIPVFFPFHINDLSHANEIRKQFPQLEILPIPSTYSESFSVFKDVIFSIGERLHFSVMAVLSGCPLFSINYGKKHHDFLSSIGADELGFKPEEVTYENIKYSFNHREDQNFNFIFQSIAYLKDKQFKEANEFIKHL